MEHSSAEANGFSTSQEIPYILWGLWHSQGPATCPRPDPSEFQSALFDPFGL